MRKTILILFLAMLPSSMLCQEKPVIKMLTVTRVVASGLPTATLHIKPASNAAAINILIPASGDVDAAVANLPADSYAIVWQTTAAGENSKPEAVRVYTDAQAIAALATQTLKVSDDAAINGMLATDRLLSNTKAVYKRSLITTNFNIPIARFDAYKPEYNNGSLVSSAKGNVSLFSSIGAGFGISLGRATVSRNSEGKVIDEEFSNTLGFFLGVLYESGTGDNPKNVFAPTLSIAILDFQVGVGYEYGKIEANQERPFVTISYGIPIYKLFKTNHRVFLDSKGFPVSVEKL
ncbi:MAG: hypothetical protein CFE23_11910 [Flavobacterium sp. BFFFF1]|uniref:hypothetical protein n=1 Tax=unclassified Flavobacterium TaxID=196869 RepID=UPI000BD5B10E|nr:MULTISPECIES: hypothetical protein [unclassified Flavobacterium]OYU79953.1 MAG: hypothetical protein CFE23_11910 [Flavobacterium sp. BFFFF1]